MRVLFRVDAGLQIGSGHVARCLTLADVIEKQRGQATFVCRDHEGHLSEWIQSRGHEVRMLSSSADLHYTNDHQPDNHLPHAAWLGTSQPVDAAQTIDVIDNDSFDWLVIDHYAIDARWEKQLRTLIPRSLVIDDLADREHLSNVLLDQNFHPHPEDRYSNRVPTNCHLMLGPKFALLRPEFAEARSRANHSDEIRRLMIFMGGMDEHNVTSRVLRMLKHCDHVLPHEIHIVIGSANPHRDLLQRECDALQESTQHHTLLHVQVDDMASLMSRMDLAIASGGTNTWERCCLGIPTVTIAVAENQTEVSQQLDAMGVTTYLGNHHELDAPTLSTNLHQFLTNTNQHPRLRTASLDLVDGRGAERVIDCMKSVAIKQAA